MLPPVELGFGVRDARVAGTDMVVEVVVVRLDVVVPVAVVERAFLPSAWAVRGQRVRTLGSERTSYACWRSAKIFVASSARCGFLSGWLTSWGQIGPHCRGLTHGETAVRFLDVSSARRRTDLDLLCGRLDVDLEKLVVVNRALWLLPVAPCTGLVVTHCACSS